MREVLIPDHGVRVLCDKRPAVHDNILQVDLFQRLQQRQQHLQQHKSRDHHQQNQP
jgi:hypothetical protein